MGRARDGASVATPSGCRHDATGTDCLDRRTRQILTVDVHRAEFVSCNPLAYACKIWTVRRRVRQQRRTQGDVSVAVAQLRRKEETHVAVPSATVPAVWRQPHSTVSGLLRAAAKQP